MPLKRPGYIQGSYLAFRVWSRADGSLSLFDIRAADTGRKQRAKEASESFPEDAVWEAVDETVTEAVANRQPCCEERCHIVVIQAGTLKEEVEDVGHPQHIEDAGDAEQHHGIAFVWAALTPLPPLALIALCLRAEAGVALGDLPRVLAADLKYAPVGEADGERCWCVEQRHDEGAEPRVGLPGVCAPLKYVPVVTRLSPAEERWQEDQSRVNPNEDDAHPQSTWCHKRCVREWAGDGDVTVHADARQRGHGDTLQHRNHVAKHLTGELLVQASEVVEQRQRRHQAADSHQQVGVRHGLDEVAGGVVVQQRGTVKDEDHH